MANHLCIHLYDLAPDRTPAIPCARRLDAMTFAPEQEHLAHMPAHVWIELGDGRAAGASSERAWALHPTRYAEHDAYVGLAAALLAGDEAAARRWSERESALLGQPATIAPPPYVGQAQALEARGNVDGAADLLRRVAVTQADVGEMLPFFPADVRIGALLYRAARYADAKTAFAEALAHRPRDPRANFGMALTLRALGDEAGALEREALFRRYWAGGALTMRDF
jgi:tetratricopeptide (TPR) repeat protein